MKIFYRSLVAKRYGFSMHEEGYIGRRRVFLSFLRAFAGYNTSLVSDFKLGTP